MERTKKIIHFLHIGKTGGTAVKHALGPYTTNHAYEIILHNHPYTLKNVPVGEKVFAFVRDPIERFVSSFYSRKRQGQPRYFLPWSDDEKYYMEYFDIPNDLACALSSTDEKNKEHARLAMNAIVHVRSSYWDWFIDEEYFNNRIEDILFIGHQERLDDDFEELKQKLELPQMIKLPDGDIASHRSPAGLDKQLDDRAVYNLKKWYEDDYKFILLCDNLNLDKVS